MSFEAPIIAQALEVIVRHRPGITQRELAEAIFGSKGSQQRVNQDCSLLTGLGYIIRDDTSGVARYSKGRAGPTERRG
jgi:hypothetical protein